MKEIPLQEDLSGIIESIDAEILELIRRPKSFLGSLMAQTKQFDGWMKTIVLFLKAAKTPDDLIVQMKEFRAHFNQFIQTSTTKTFNQDLLLDIRKRWSGLQIRLKNVKFSKEIFKDAVCSILQFSLNELSEEPDLNKWRSLGMVTVLSDLDCFCSQKSREEISFPLLREIYERLKGSCIGKQQDDELMKAKGTIYLMKEGYAK